MCVSVCTESCPTLCNPKDGSPPTPLSMRFPRQEYWSVEPFPSPGNLPYPGIEPVSLALTGGFLPLSYQGNPVYLDSIPQISLHNWCCKDIPADGSGHGTV